MYASYWASFGTIYLIILTIQDYKNKRRVDDRKNAFMFGITVSLISHTGINLLYHFAVLFLAGIVNRFAHKIKAFGGADNNTLTWLFMGYGLISPNILLWFFINFAAATVVYIFFKNVVFKYSDYVQFYGVILVSFIFTNVIFRLYFF